MLEKSDEINFLNQKKPKIIESKPNNINTIFINKEIKFNNYFKHKHKNNSLTGNNENNKKNNFNNILKMDREIDEDVDIYDEIKMKYNKNRNKISS